MNEWNEKKIYEPSGIKIVLLDRDLLINSGGTLGDDGWKNVDFNSL